ncbi:MAG: helix-turn-helix domain-containing protein [Verrucomicrobia bacterium]|nr:helix-turn-helix domain-containing protein [Verrucomicrobiota bacterium]
MTNQNERLMKILQAGPNQQAEIDRILDGKVTARVETTSGPLLLGMSAAAKFLGVSRATLWRMIRSGRLTKVEILPGSFRVRRADLEQLANGPAFASEGAPAGDGSEVSQ